VFVLLEVMEGGGVFGELNADDLVYSVRMAKGNVEKNHPGQHQALMQKAARG